MSKADAKEAIELFKESLAMLAGTLDGTISDARMIDFTLTSYTAQWNKGIREMPSFVEGCAALIRLMVELKLRGGRIVFIDPPAKTEDQ